MPSNFSVIPNRTNADFVTAEWFNALKSAGINIETFLGGGFVPESTFTPANNISSAADITGMIFDHTLYRTVVIDIDIRRKTDTALSEVVATGEVILQYRLQSAGWGDPIVKFDGDDHGLDFTVTASGQVQYTSSNIAGANYFGSVKFKATTFAA